MDQLQQQHARTRSQRESDTGDGAPPPRGLEDANALLAQIDRELTRNQQVTTEQFLNNSRQGGGQ